MSFCNDVKSELALLKGHKCCQRAESAGLMLGLKPSGDGFLFRSGQADVAHLAASLLNRALDASAQERVTPSGRWYTLAYPDLSEAKIGYPDARVDRSVMEKPCCAAAFLRGAFLSCGQLSDPRKNYRLDLLLPCETAGISVCELLRDQGFMPRLSVRRDGTACVYFIDSTSIEDLLTLMGATVATLALMEIKVEKNYTNAVNRRGNFDTANYIKTYETAAAQTEAIRWLKEQGALEDLPEPTLQIALLRLEHTDASLKELAALSHMGRSSVDRRLKSLMALYEKQQKGR